MQVGDVDLTSPDAFVAAVPHAYFRLLREEAPIPFSPRASDSGFCNVVRHVDIQAMERNVEFFSNDPRYAWLDKVQAIAKGRATGLTTLVYNIYEVR